MESMEGIILGPGTGFIAALIGSTIARIARPDAFWMFGIIAESFSVLMAGFLVQARWKPVLAAYLAMLAAYFIHPFGRVLPLWTIIDVLLALILIYPAAKLSQNLFRNNIKRLPVALGFVSFVSIATDSLVRIFLLVPCGLHTMFFNNFDELFGVFVGAAVDSYIEDLIVVAVSLIVVVPLMITLVKLGLFKKKQPLEGTI